MIYDLNRSLDLRWLFDPVLHSSLDDLVSNIKATVGTIVISRRPLALGLHQEQMQFHYQEVDIERHLQYAVIASQAFCFAGAKAVATTKSIFWKSFSVSTLATKDRGYLSDKLVHIILLSIASVSLDGRISSLPAEDSGDVTNHIFYSVAWTLYTRKLEVVHKEVGGCHESKWMKRLCDDPAKVMWTSCRGYVITMVGIELLWQLSNWGKSRLSVSFFLAIFSPFLRSGAEFI